MKISTIAIFALAFVVSVATMFAADPPPWAYCFEGPPQAGDTPVPARPANTDQTPRSIPGATAQYARAQIANRFGPADWFPGEHPQMPDVVAHGKQPKYGRVAYATIPTARAARKMRASTACPSSILSTR